MKVTKNQKIKLSELVINRNDNVRDKEAYEDLRALKDDLAFRGQQVEAAVEKVGPNQFKPLQGFLRGTALLDLQAEGKIDPLTVKLNPVNGEPIPGSGKVFETIHATVYEGLTDRERMSLLFDHSQRRGLNAAETHLALEKLFAALYSEIDVVIMTRNLLEQWYPPKRAIKKLKDKDGNDTTVDDPTDLLNYFRGVIQTAKIAWRSPTLLREAWLNKLRKKQSWPRKSELLEGAKIFEDECKSDVTQKMTQDKPGPKFMAWWDRFHSAQIEAEEAGESRGKNTSMLSRGQVEDCKKTAGSRVVRGTLSGVLNDGTFPREKLPLLDKFQQKIEAKLTPDEVAELDAIFTGSASTETVKTS